MESMQFFMNQANVLIVGYCYSNSKALIEMLNQKGYGNIKNIINGELALKSLRESLPDIILIETALSNIDVYEFCKKLKNDDYFKDISIILISEEKNLDKDKIFAAGAVDYLTVPFNREEVLKRVEMQLQLRFMQLELKKCENKQSYYGQKILNDQLMTENNKLKSELFEKKQQLDEITLELKEFNIVLEEEINERTRTEEALKESERQFRYSLEEAPLPIMLYTEDGNVKKINRTWSDITGYTIKDISTISQWADISEIFMSDLESVNITTLFNSEKRQNNGDFSVKTRNGDIRIWNFYSAYIGELQDGHKLFMRVAIDITEKRHMEELQKSVEEERKKLYEIKEYDKIKTEFFSNISHELRTPINVIFSALQMHELRLKDCVIKENNEDKYKYTKIMKQNCYRILRLINNIIDITKIDSGYFDINEQNVNIISLIENITLSVADYIEDKGLSLIFDTDVEEKITAFDSEKMERIILNLLSNAVKFTSFGGEIMVSIKDCTESICIIIKDTGRGIPEDKLNNIFERFMQVDKSLTRDHEGSGIGLSLVKCLVELHGGTISVKSKLNYGTEFIIYLPCKLTDKVNEEFSFCDSAGENYIEKINIEFSDIYK